MEMRTLVLLTHSELDSREKRKKGHNPDLSQFFFLPICQRFSTQYSWKLWFWWGRGEGLSFLSVQRGLGVSPCWTNLGAHTPSRDHPQNPAGGYLSSSTSPHSWKTGRSLSSWACVSEAEVSESSSVITAEATLVNTECGQERRGPATSSLGLRPSSALPGRPDAVAEGRGFRRPSPAL